MSPRPHTSAATIKSPHRQFSLGSLVLLVTVAAVVLAMIRSAVVTHSLSENQAAAAMAGTLVGAVVGAALLSGEMRSVVFRFSIGALVGAIIGFLAATRVEMGVTLVGSAAIVAIALLVRPRPKQMNQPNRSPWSE